jgi:hypothetical protein
MKRAHTVPDDAVDTLRALLDARGPEDTTFRRMVVWYRAVTDELGCREAYEQLLTRLLAAASPTAA